MFGYEDNEPSMSPCCFSARGTKNEGVYFGKLDTLRRPKSEHEVDVCLFRNSVAVLTGHQSSRYSFFTMKSLILAQDER